MTTIPSTFHFVYGLRPQTEAFPLQHHLAVASCAGVNPGARIVMHLHERPWGEWWERTEGLVEIAAIEPDEAIARHDYLDRGMGAFRYAHLADVARLEVLDREGGYYADIDSIFIRPVPAEWSQRSYVMGHERPPAGARGSLCNAWIGSAPGAVFGRRWLEALPEAFDGSWSNHSTVLPYELSVLHPEEISVEPEERFFALDWTPSGVADLLERSVELPSEALSLHLWEHLWASPERLGVSAFHAGLLTPEYVTFADTTYARLARPHLADDVAVSPRAWAEQQAELRRLRARRRTLRLRRRAGRAVRAVTSVGAVRREGGGTHG